MTTSNKAIRAKIKSFSLNRDKLRNQAHEIACLIMRHAAPTYVNSDCSGTGDATTAPTLLAEMPKSWAAQMKAWFDLFTPIRMNLSTGKTGYSMEYKALKTDDERKAFWKYEDAINTPFYEASGEPDVVLKGLDNYLKLLENMPSRIEKDIAEGKVKPESVDALKELALRIASTNFKPVTAASNSNKAAPVAAAA